MESLMLHTKFRENQSAGSRGEDFLKVLSETDLSGPPSFFWMFSLLLKELIFTFLFLPYMDMVAILVIWPASY